MNITLEYQNKKKKETNGSNNNLVQENRNSKQIGWLTLNDITCHFYHMNHRYKEWGPSHFRGYLGPPYLP